MIEIIGMTVEDAITIEQCGANRIELVSALTDGGLTPSFAMIEKVVNSVNIPVNVMVRPHANSFVYSESDIDIMRKDIKIIHDLGANGVVLGVLDKVSNINENHLNILLEESKGLDITFHKAIDETELIKSVKTLNKIPQITNILTSGGKGCIKDNISIINDICKEASDLKILLGGGLTLENIEYLKENTFNCDFHFGTAVRFNNSHFEKIDKHKLTKLIKIINS